LQQARFFQGSVVAGHFHISTFYFFSSWHADILSYSRGRVQRWNLAAGETGRISVFHPGALRIENNQNNLKKQL
jgi:hypothetical protein